MSLLQAYYPEIEETRLEIDARLRLLEDKLLTVRKTVSDQINHEGLQTNIINLYGMVKEAADNQSLLHKELAQLKNQVAIDHSAEARIRNLELGRREAEDKTSLLQQGRRERLYGYEGYSPRKFNDVETDAKIFLYKTRLEEESMRFYQNRLLRNIATQEELELEQLNRNRQAFERSYRNWSAHDLLGTSISNRYQTNSFGGNYYGRYSDGLNLNSLNYGAKIDYRGRLGQSMQHPSYGKEQQTNTQPSPNKLRSSYRDYEMRTQERQKPDEKYHYDYVHEKGNQRGTLDVKDLDEPNKKKLKPSVTFMENKPNRQRDQNSDSLDEHNPYKGSRRRRRRSNSLNRSTSKRKSLSKTTYQDRSNLDKYSNVSRVEKSPSKKRRQIKNQNNTRKNVLQRIHNRIAHAWAVYQDSAFRNTKHEKDHLFRTYALEMRLRAQMRDKLQAHPIVQKRFGLTFD